MPHAALWVVQLCENEVGARWYKSFNAARGFVGGAARNSMENMTLTGLFQCRTRLCGWCSTMIKFVGTLPL